jgi:hypothetical protein
LATVLTRATSTSAGAAPILSLTDAWRVASRGLTQFIDQF